MENTCFNCKYLSYILTKRFRRKYYCLHPKVDGIKFICYDDPAKAHRPEKGIPRFCPENYAIELTNEEWKKRQKERENENT